MPLNSKNRIKISQIELIYSVQDIDHYVLCYKYYHTIIAEEHYIY